MAEDKAFCEEILRVILSVSELLVMDVAVQWVETNLQGRSVLKYWYKKMKEKQQKICEIIERI